MNEKFITKKQEVDSSAQINICGDGTSWEWEEAHTIGSWHNDHWFQRKTLSGKSSAFLR